MVNIDKMVEIIRPAVGIGVDEPPTILGRFSTEVMVVRFLRTSSCTIPKRMVEDHLYGPGGNPPVHGDIDQEVSQNPQTSDLRG